jgi:outer membrane protein assembly factor BamB
VFSVAADGLLRSLIPDTGDLAMAPAKFLPPNSTATGLVWADGYVYAATANTCGGAPEAVWAMDFGADDKQVISWETGGASVAGLALGPDGTVYVATGAGGSQYANSIVALEGGSLKVRDWVRQDAPFTSMPVVLSEGEKTYVAATSGTRLYLLDAAALGGADHRTPLTVVGEPDLRFSADGLASWRDGAGTRCIIGVVFALASGGAGANAVLYALDPASGKELWNSGTTITAPASAGLSAGTGQVYVVTADNTVWSFGIPLVIN